MNWFPILITIVSTGKENLSKYVYMLIFKSFQVISVVRLVKYGPVNAWGPRKINIKIKFLHYNQ